MKFVRRFTAVGWPVVDQIEWDVREASIPGAGFRMEVEVPKAWSQDATNVFSQKYLRKAGVPNFTNVMPENNLPDWLYRCVPAPDHSTRTVTFGSETSAQQVFHRMAGCWTYWGWRGGYFWQEKPPKPYLVKDAENCARAFYDELYWMLANQYAAPNSPQWFNTGLHWAYGIEGPDSGQWTIKDYSHLDGIQDKHEIVRINNSYERPQVHACYIQPVADTLVGDGGMLELWAKEARLFKHGSGTGTNFSNIRAKGEPLSGGGVSSGLMSFLRVGDSNAGSIKSGGVTRRAAKMVVLDLDHPEIEEFIDWKAREEAKAAAMHAGSRLIMEVYSRSAGNAYVPEAVIDRFNAGFKPEVFGIDGMEAEAVASVDGQNSNNSVRVSDAFLQKVDNNDIWHLIARTKSIGVNRSLPASDLWQRICRAAWASGDPGLQFNDTMNAWHTCPNDGEIRASNPCSEYLFLDSTACNLASLNLCRFLGTHTEKPDSTKIQLEDKQFDCYAFEHAVRLWTTVLDISVSMASYPSREIAEGSYNYRTLGLGYANLGGLLARMDLRYDSDEGRALASGITALMTGVAYKTSAEMAAYLVPFPRWETNAESMQRVLRNHARASRREMNDDWYEGLNIFPFLCRPLEETNPRDDTLWHTVDRVWNEVLSAGSFRNAQVTLLAPTGTIRLVMDCATSGVEPFYARRETKQLAGGGTMVFEYPGVLDQDCAVPAEPGGACLLPDAHVRMVAAVQPFLSGGVSKTINLPNSATVADVDRVYRLAHRLGLKSVALYRDGSKLSQPLSAAAGSEDKQQRHLTASEQKIMHNALRASVKILDEGLKRGQRRELPSRRPSTSQIKLEVGGHSVYLGTGDHEDGELAEIFLHIGKAGSDVRAWAECFCKALSIGLQYGVPLSAFVHAFERTRFEPSGMVVGDTRIRFCDSLPDLVMRHLAVERLKRDDLASVPRTEDAQEVAKTAANLAPVIGRATHSTPPLVMEARLCPGCGSQRLQRTGTCLTCSSCGWNEGCG